MYVIVLFKCGWDIKVPKNLSSGHWFSMYLQIDSYISKILAPLQMITKFFSSQNLSSTALMQNPAFITLVPKKQLIRSTIWTIKSRSTILLSIIFIGNVLECLPEFSALSFVAYSSTWSVRHFQAGVGIRVSKLFISAWIWLSAPLRNVSCPYSVFHLGISWYIMQACNIARFNYS